MRRPELPVPVPRGRVTAVVVLFACLAVAAGFTPPAAGLTPSGRTTAVPVPAAAQAVDTRHPTRVIGDGTARSCTSRKVVRAVRRGGVITFDCGPRHVTIAMRATAKVLNTSPSVVLDGGGKVTLDGGGKRRILYQNTCDRRQIWTTSHCDDQSEPQLVVQNLTLAHGNSTGQRVDGGGGGAMFVRGGRLKVVDTTFVGNRCDPSGPDLGGAAIRVLDQGGDAPVYVVGSRFRGGRCSNGGALSSIGVSWEIYDSVFRGNRAVGRGANPPRPGSRGGGSGGGIYLDGNTFHLLLAGTVMEHNVAREGGGAVFFVSNDRTGTMAIRQSRLRSNPSLGFQNAPGIFYLGRGPIEVSRTCPPGAPARCRRDR